MSQSLPPVLPPVLHPSLSMSQPYRTALAALRPGLAAAAGFSAVISVLMLTGSVYMLQIYDRVLASGSVPTLLTLFAIVVVLHGFLAVYDFLRMRLLSRLAARLDASLAPQAFRLGLAEGAAGGQPLRDLDMLRGFVAGPSMLALFDLPFVVLFLTVLFGLHPLFGWLTLGGAALVAGLAWANRAATRGGLQAAQGAESQARGFAETAQRAASTLRALGMAGPVTRHWQRIHDQSLAFNQDASGPSEALAAASRSLRMLLQSGLLTLGAWLVIAGEVSGGAIIASSILSGRALAPLDQLIGQWRSIGQAAEAHRRLSVALARSPADQVPRTDLPAPAGRIEVTGLTRLAPARPGGADRLRLLQDVSFTLEPGDGLGVVGTSASGKSTLARLLVGAIQPDAGEIRFDGATPDQWAPDVLGRHIGYLPQQVDLLQGTVRDNIARFDPEAADAAVIEAAQVAGVHEMILRLPDGYGTDLGRAGQDMPLSGGQVQRIGLARAIYGWPRIVVLDEPNAHLDMAGEAALTRALTALRARGATVIVMAHRAGALAAVNRLIVLQNGQVIQSGARDEVLAILGAPQPVTIPAGNPVTSPAGLQAPAAAAVTAAVTTGPVANPAHRQAVLAQTDMAPGPAAATTLSFLSGRRRAGPKRPMVFRNAAHSATTPVDLP